eukprot:TRINITY_DN3938_c0_g1_i1.p1 TRINITY_DN3938_c0_g1~~TRINITY_DN3938_c0_g1_i1.p1  ORF type:complete len:195 (-),score=27.16 TRINITY_DN3938_c0_g1_i1:294-878(-)
MTGIPVDNKDMEVVGQAVPIHSQEDQTHQANDGTEVPAKRAFESDPTEDMQLHEDKKVLLEADLKYARQLSKSKEIYPEEQENGKGPFQLGQVQEQQQTAARKSRPSSAKHVSRKVEQASLEEQQLGVEDQDSKAPIEEQTPTRDIEYAEVAHVEQKTQEQSQENPPGKRWSKIIAIGAFAIVGLHLIKKVVGK